MSELEELYDSKLALYMAMRLGRLAIVFIFVMFHLALWSVCRCRCFGFFRFPQHPSHRSLLCKKSLDSNLIQAISLSGLSLTVTVAVSLQKMWQGGPG